MRKITGHPKYSAAVLQRTQSLMDELGSKSWKSQVNEVKQFKKQLKKEGLLLQEGRCAWCSLLLGKEGRRSVHRDHIAPKSIYGQWTYHPLNLVLVCDFCNTEVKKDLDTVQVGRDPYEASEFWLVHPYLEDAIEDHIVFEDFEDGIGIIIVGKSDKGRWTIDKLQLDSPSMTVRRAEEANIQRLTRLLSEKDQKLVADAVSGLGGRHA